MKPVALMLILAGSALLVGCSSTPSGSKPAASSTQAACICGTHEAQIHGCPHPDCASGKGNPDNPKCTCAPLVPAGAPTKGN